MKKHRFLRVCGLFLAGTVSTSLVAAAPANQAPRPNIVVILSDDLGIGDLGRYGQEKIATPNLDQMAREGMTFRQFYAGSTVCAPSRAALMTGLHTGHVSVRGNREEMPLDPAQPVLPEILRQAGYTSAMFGKWGLGLADSPSSPEKRGWDVFLGHLHHLAAHKQMPTELDVLRGDRMEKQALPPGTYANDVFTASALNFIAQQPRDKPFFVYLSVTIPHAELVVAPEHLAHYQHENGDSKFAPETPWPSGRHYAEQAQPRAAYAALVTRVDAYVGQVLATLKAKGLADNTLVIFASDNGTHVEGGRRREDVAFFNSSAGYRGVKRDLFEGGIREPFIVWWPGNVAANSENQFVGAFWDLLPTFAELAGAKAPPGDGLSILPTLLGRGTQVTHPYLYWEFHESGGKQALLQGRWKALRENLAQSSEAPVQLYDLEQDPGEQQDVAPQHPDRVNAMRNLMDGARTPSSHFNFGRQ